MLITLLIYMEDLISLTFVTNLLTLMDIISMRNVVKQICIIFI